METLKLFLVSKVFIEYVYKRITQIMGLEIKEKDEIKDKILDQAHDMFMRYGIRSVTMDDIAKELGMSKKTIYQYFKDKNELVNLFITRLGETEYQIIKSIETEAKDAIDFILKVSAHFNSLYANSNPSMVYDLEKYYPEARKMQQEFEEKISLEVMQKNIEWGIKDQLYRKEVDVEFVSLLWMRMFELACDEKTFPPDKFNLWETHNKLMDFMMRGLITLKGFQQLEEYQNQITASNNK